MHFKIIITGPEWSYIQMIMLLKNIYMNIKIFSGGHFHIFHSLKLPSPLLAQRKKKRQKVFFCSQKYFSLNKRMNIYFSIRNIFWRSFSYILVSLQFKIDIPVAWVDTQPLPTPWYGSATQAGFASIKYLDMFQIKNKLLENRILNIFFKNNSKNK